MTSRYAFYSKLLMSAAFRRFFAVFFTLGLVAWAFHWCAETYKPIWQEYARQFDPNALSYQPIKVITENDKHLLALTPIKRIRLIIDDPKCILKTNAVMPAFIKEKLTRELGANVDDAEGNRINVKLKVEQWQLLLSSVIQLTLTLEDLGSPSNEKSANNEAKGMWTAAGIPLKLKLMGAPNADQKPQIQRMIYQLVDEVNRIILLAQFNNTIRYQVTQAQEAPGPNKKLVETDFDDHPAPIKMVRVVVQDEDKRLEKCHIDKNIIKNKIGRALGATVSDSSRCHSLVTISVVDRGLYDPTLQNYMVTEIAVNSPFAAKPGKSKIKRIYLNVSGRLYPDDYSQELNENIDMSISEMRESLMMGGLIGTHKDSLKKKHHGLPNA